MHSYTEEEAAELLSVARSAIELRIRSPRFNPETLQERLKMFTREERVLVRLIHYPTRTTRSSSEISAKTRMSIAVIRASLSAAFGPQTNVPVSAKELGELVLELDVLMDPEELPSSYIKRRSEVDPKAHGLAIEYGIHRSTVLPSYAAENNLDSTRYLEAACIAAGLPKEYWKQPKLTISRFEVHRYVEETPNGKVKIL